MKKAITLILFLTLSGFIFAINPPSYVGRPIQDVLDELDYVKILDEKHNRYIIFIDETILLELYCNDNGLIRSVKQFRWDFSRNIAICISDTIIHILGEPDIQDIAETGILTISRTWQNENVGTIFGNEHLSAYVYYLVDLPIKGRCTFQEYWY